MEHRSNPFIASFCLLALLFYAAAPSLAENLDSPIVFNKTLTQHQPLIDGDNFPDYQASARWNTDGSLSAWYCGTEKFPNNGQTHDAIYTTTVVPGQTELNPVVALHSAGDNAANHDRFDSLNVCSPTVVDLPQATAPDWTLMYYECSPVMYDFDSNHPINGNPVGGFVASFLQICLARHSPSGWQLYNEDLWASQGVFGDPQTTKPTPVIKVSDTFLATARLADDNETAAGSFEAPIDGHIYGDPSVLSQPAFYGAGHPAAVINELAGGGHELWLYYWDSEAHKMARVRSTDGINFFDKVHLNFTHGTHPKYFPDLEIDGQKGVWIGTSLFSARRWFEYSLDGLNFQAPAFGNPDESFLLATANPGYLCPAPGAGSFVSDRFGHVQGERDFGFLSGEGFLRGSDNGVVNRCHSQDEENKRGSTWGIYYLEGEFADVDIANDSCEAKYQTAYDPAQPNGRVSEGTLMDGWDVDNTIRTGRNRVLKTQGANDVFEMAFFNNGKPMDGTNVCFMKRQSAISQSLDGFAPGREYRVRAWVNARTSAFPGTFPTPEMRLELGGTVVEPGILIAAVDAKNSADEDFHEVVSSNTFTPTSSGPYTLKISQIAAGDATLLVDRVIIEAVPPALEVANSSCEDGVINGVYGLVDQGTTMPGWQVSDPHLTGRNTAGMVFYNNGATVDGTEVCLLKQQSAMSQLVPGFERGKKYRVRLWANARTALNPGVYPTPIVRIKLGGQVIESGIAVAAVDPKDVYATAFQEIVSSTTFTALASESHELVLEQIEAGDPTLLIDRVVIEEVASLGGS